LVDFFESFPSFKTAALYTLKDVIRRFIIDIRELLRQYTLRRTNDESSYYHWDDFRSGIILASKQVGGIAESSNINNDTL